LRAAVFHRYDCCRGITLWRWGQFNIEAWWCPRWYEIVPHSHPNEAIELVPLWGHATFYRQSPEGVVESVCVDHRRWFRRHTVPMGWRHWFTVGASHPLVFLNLSWWRQGVKPSSAADDFALPDP
jgi:hypothetical protein